NKVALITGGTSGIGLETAKLFQKEGARVIVTGTHAGRLDEAARILGSSAMVLNVDSRDPAQIDRAIGEIVERHDRIDTVFANAGAGTAGPLETRTPAQVEEQFSLNFSGVLFTIQKVVAHMRKGGSIVVNTSFLNEIGTPGLSVLSATKAALRSLVRSAGAELAPRGIRVNAVSPGPTPTPFHSKLGLSEQDLAAVGAQLQEAVPLKRFGDPREIATAVLYLASDAASFVTGAELVVDGGLTQF